MADLEDEMLESIYEVVRRIDSLDVKPEYKATILQVVLQQMLERGSSAFVRKPAKVATRKGQSRGPLPDRIGELTSDGFFKEPRAIQEVRQELQTRGYFHNDSAVGMALLSLVRRKMLRRIFETKEGKKQYLYTNP